MGRDRLELQALLETMCAHVYFQPPNTLTMEYPCVIYKRDSARTDHADNNPYYTTKRYLVTVVDRDPDSIIPDKVATIPSCAFNRHYTADDLNHDVFTIFF